jgi:peptide/nickel transport system permease protein
VTTYIARRVALVIPILFGITFFAFAVMLMTGDPAGAMAGQHASPEIRARIRTQLGLDQPLHVQYLRYVGRLARGDLGRSVIRRTPVTYELARFLPATIELSLAAMAVALIVGIPVGVLAAYRHNSIIDLGTMTGALVGVSMPVFWLGLLLLYIFGLRLNLFPIGGRLSHGIELQTLREFYHLEAWLPRAVQPVVLPLAGFISNLYLLDSMLTGNWTAFRDAFRHLVLPAIALGSIPTAYIARITRSAMLDVLHQDYIRTARAKGLRELSVVVGHALRNALLPVVTVIGLQVGSLMAGAVLTETIFSWPGVGRWVVDAITFRDFPVVQGAVLVFALSYVAINLIVDLSYAWIDPRIRYG